MQIPEAVRQLREVYGESQQTFSNRLGIALNSVARYERQESQPASAIRVKLSQLAREKGRRDLYLVFAFGANETAEVGALNREMQESLQGIAQDAKVQFDQFQLSGDKAAFDRGMKNMDTLLNLIEKFLKT